jgi:hypothetical protein
MKGRAGSTVKTGSTVKVGSAVETAFFPRKRESSVVSQSSSPRFPSGDSVDKGEIMIRLIRGAFGILCFLASSGRLEGQIFNAPALGDDLGSVAFHLGMLAPQTTFEDEMFGESSFGSGLAMGLTAAAWPTWPLDGKLGLRVSMNRSEVDGQNSTSEFAPMALNDPTVWTITGEIAARLPMGSGFPYASVGIGGRHYTWARSVHEVSQFLAWTGAVGYEYRPATLGPFGLSAELRGYRSDFRAFGIDDGTWEDGFYGGDVGGVPATDLLFTTGVVVYF